MWREEAGGKRGENFVRDENYYSRVRSRNTCLYVCLYYELVEYVMYPLCYSRVVRIVEYVVYAGLTAMHSTLSYTTTS